MGGEWTLITTCLIFTSAPFPLSLPLSLHLFFLSLSLLSLHLSLSLPPSLSQEAAWTISNITAGQPTQIQAVIDMKLIPPLVQIMVKVGREQGMEGGREKRGRDGEG